jgi:hypothetical protein
VRSLRRRGTPASDEEALHATSTWFVRHGLPYFVPEQREAARRALRARRTVVSLLLTVLLALAAGVGLAFLLGSVAVAPATLTLLVGIAVVFYAATALRARPIATWAVARTLSSLRLLLPLATRALPLLLLFVTFLFINAEVWQVSATLDGAVLWLTVLLFAVVAVVFLLVRLPEELEMPDGPPDRGQIAEACRATPLAERAPDVLEAADDEDLHAALQVKGFEKANLLLVLVIAQGVQVLLLSLSVFVFFLVFGALVMDGAVQESWTQSPIHAADFLDNVSLELVQVSVFLAAFSGLYFTVYAVTDEAYRDQFFTEVKNELDRAVGIRAVYLVLRRSLARDPV